MIDFHSHLDLYPSPLEVAKEASKRNIFTLAVTTSPRAWIATSRVLGDLPNIEVALGLHPEIADQKESERDILIEQITNTDFIGEVGLDGSPKYRSNFQLQVSILDSLLQECSKQGGRILSIHSRGAASQVLDLLDKYPDSGTTILHWFSGSKSELDRAIDRGCWFSFGPAGTRTESGLRILQSIPLNRLLPESDGPFGNLKGMHVMPWEAHTISNSICQFRRISRSLIEDQFKRNLTEIFNSKGIKVHSEVEPTNTKDINRAKLQSSNHYQRPPKI